MIIILHRPTLRNGLWKEVNYSFYDENIFRDKTRAKIDILNLRSASCVITYGLDVSNILLTKTEISTDAIKNDTKMHIQWNGNEKIYRLQR